MSSDVNAISLDIKVVKSNVEEIRSNAKQMNLNVEEMSLDVRALHGAQKLKALKLHIKFTKASGDSVFNDDLDSKEAEDIYGFFCKAFEECCKQKYRPTVAEVALHKNCAVLDECSIHKHKHCYYNVLMPGFIENFSINDPKIICLKFILTPKMHCCNITDFKTFYCPKSKQLWEKLKSLLEIYIEDTKVSLRLWELGSIVIHALVRKISGYEWTDKDLSKVQNKLYVICEQFEMVFHDLNCACEILEAVRENDGEIVMFEIHPFSVCFEEFLKIIDLSSLKLRFEYWLIQYFHKAKGKKKYLYIG